MYRHIPRNACCHAGWNLPAKLDIKGELWILLPGRTKSSPLQRRRMRWGIQHQGSRASPAGKGGFLLCWVWTSYVYKQFFKWQLSQRTACSTVPQGGLSGTKQKPAGFCSHAHLSPLRHSGNVNKPPPGRRFVQCNWERKELPELILKNIVWLCPEQNIVLAQEGIMPWKAWMWTHKSSGLDLQTLTRWGKL